jgi:hypothetical protein
LGEGKGKSTMGKPKIAEVLKFTILFKQSRPTY